MRKLKKEIQISALNKYISFYVYCSAKVEGIKINFSKTQDLVENGKVDDLSEEDSTKIINLRETYKMLINDSFYDEPTDLNSLCEINKSINLGLYHSAGKIRTHEVRISGTSYIPPIPDPFTINNSILDIVEQKDKNVIVKGAELFAYIAKAQPFIDGNKRTANLFANHYLLQNGYGIFRILENYDEEFAYKLVDYYENDQKLYEFVNFLVGKCYSLLEINEDKSEIIKEIAKTYKDSEEEEMIEQ